jgi:hypothetical protein
VNARFAPLLLVLFSVVGCDLDPFRLDDRTVIGNYYLNRFESGSFYLCHEFRDCSGYGVLGGTVRSIGWNDRYIVVWQNPDFGDSGWVVVDSQTDKITGLLTDDQLTSMNSIPGIQTLGASDAWKKLGGS